MLAGREEPVVVAVKREQLVVRARLGYYSVAQHE